MELSQKQVEEFRTEGFLRVPEFFCPRTVVALQAVFEELVADGKFSNVAADNDGVTYVQHKQNLQILPASIHHPLLRALPFHPKVRGAIAQLLGDSIFKFQDQLILKPARIGTATNWHQDNFYFEVSDPTKGMAMWTAVHDANVSNGTIKMIPRSFNTAVEHTRDLEGDHDFRCYPNEDQAVPIEMAAGGVVFFYLATPHCTGPNPTDGQRAGLAYHFLHTDFTSEELKSKRPHPTTQLPSYYLAGEEGGPHMTGDLYTRGEREYGCNMEELLDSEVQRLADAVGC